MATLQGGTVPPGAPLADLEQAVQSAKSADDTQALAATFLRLLQVLDSDNAPAVRELLGRLFGPGSNADVALFLHVAAAADALRNEHAVHVLRDLGVAPAALLEYLSPEKLVETGLVDAALARRRYQRIIGLETRTMTFDLARDCAYGFAELAVLLARAPVLSDAVWDRVLELVGRYALEPFRALATAIDLVVFTRDGALDATSLAWLAQSPWRGHQDLPAVLSMFLDDPRGVELAARLTVLGAVSFPAMVAFFDPRVQGFRDYEGQYRLEQQQATQSGLNALAMSAMLGDDDDDEDEGEDEAGEPMDVDERLPSDEPATADPPSAHQPSELSPEAKMKTALRFLGDIFAHADPDSAGDVLRTALSYVAAFPIVAGSSDAIAGGLSKLACRLLERDSSRDNVLHVARTYLAHISHKLGEDVWQLLNTLALANFDEHPQFWTDFFREFMLPSLDFESTDDALLWRFDIQQRFEIYNDLQTRVATTNLFVKTRFAKAEKETKNILKRLTKIDAQDKTVPALLEVFGQCPLPSLAAFVNQVESYNIGSLVARSTTSQIPSLAMDMLPLIIMQQLTTGGRLAQQQDGLYESRWFRLLASFTGEVASLHPDFDFLSIIALVLRQFSQGDYTQLIVLEQLILRLSGIPTMSNLSIPQIVALNSAPTAREIAQVALTEQTHTSRQRLVHSLQEHNLLLEVFVALCHAYNHMLLDGTNAKVVVNRRDLVAELIIVYAELIGGSQEFDPVELCTKYAVPLPFALVLWRFGTRELGSLDFVTRLPAYENWAGKISTELYLSFWHMSLYDIVFDERLYITVGEIRDPKLIEKSSLSHKLRLKSVKQKLNSSKDSWFTAPSGAWDPEALVCYLLLPRIVVSPVDAVYTSRFLQLLHEIEPAEFNFGAVGETLFSRGVILSILHTASPLELESFATFVTDLYEYLIRHNQFGTDQQNWLHVITDTLLEVAVPTQDYIPLSNAFSFLQKAASVFPISTADGDKLVKRVHILTVSLSDGDLETSVKSLYAQLGKRRALWVGPDVVDLTPTDFYKSLCVNAERLESRLLASLRALSTGSEASEEKPEPEPKRSRRSRNERKEKKQAGAKKLDNNDLLSEIGKKEPQAPKRFEDTRQKKGWGERRERPRRRRK